MGGVIGEDDPPDSVENVCGEYPEHTEPNAAGCCKRCDALLDTPDEEDDGEA
jgi:hypothetical protein